MPVDFDNYSIAPIHMKDAWRLCDLMVSNAGRFANYFPDTLKVNLNPTLSKLFVEKKAKQFDLKEEYLFTIKENTERNIIGLIYVKELLKKEGQGELAYCIGYQYAGKGIITKAVGKIIDWAFKEAGLCTLQVIANQNNIASTRVAEKNGFIWQRTFPKNFQLPNGEFVDMELYKKGTL